MSVHLAVLYKTYLRKILTGEKTIEGRFSKVRCLPHGRVFVGDTIFLKEASGPVVATATVAQVLSFTNLTRIQVQDIVEQYAKPLCLDQAFTSRVLAARYITLMYLQNVRRINPIQLNKRDRRAWVTLARNGPSLVEVDQWQKELWSALVEK